MSSRRLVIVAVLAALGGADTAAAERPAARPTTTTAAKAKAAKAKAAKAKVAKAKAAKAKKAKARARARAKSRVARRGRTGHVLAPATNMPSGWSWPPNPDMLAAGKVCTDQLDALGVVWQPAAAVDKVATPITVPSMTFGGIKVVSWFRKPPFVMDCHLALGLTTFAKDLYELGIRELKFSRIYGYTLVRAGGVTKNVLSRHALGLAMDVRSVTDADGHESVVATDYKQDDPMLLRLEDFLNDSGGFRTVLTPKNDPISHHDHFHVEVKLEYGP